MNVTTFHADPAKIRALRVHGPLLLTLGFLCFPLFGNLFRGFKNLFQSPGISPGIADHWTAGDYLIVDYLTGALWVLVLLIENLLHVHPRMIARVYLRLDRDGLTQSSRFWTRRWPWRDLPAFTRFTHETKQSSPSIAFHLPGQDPDSLRKGDILDQYEAPLEEIAATLNDYRERALRAARAAE